MCSHGINHKFQHIMREGNKLANYLANRAINEGICKFTDYQSMDTKGRGTINSDKLNISNLRVSVNRR